MAFQKSLKIAMNAIYIHVDSEGGKHGGPLISEVINITLEGWTLANNLHAQGENTCEVTTFWHFQKKIREDGLLELSSQDWILQGFDRWGRVDPEGQETLRFGHEGAGWGMNNNLSCECYGCLIFLFGWDRFFLKEWEDLESTHCKR